MKGKIINNLPCFLTKNVVFPDQNLKLETLEERDYNSVLNSLLDYDGKLIILMPDKKIGTLCEIISSDQNASKQKYHIKVIGRYRVKISHSYNLKKAQFVEYKILKDKFSKDISLEKELVNKISKVLKKKLKNFARVANFLNIVETTHLSSSAFADSVAYNILRNNVNAKQNFLEQSDVFKKLEMTLKIVEDKINQSVIEKEIDEKVKKGLTIIQREFYLRETLKKIREELGDTSSKDQDVEKIKKILKEGKYPENIIAKIDEELKKYEGLPQSSAESGVIKNYIDWLIKLPWDKEDVENNDLLKTIKILNKNHYGLDKIKSRIVEHLATQIITKRKSSTTIICFVGPPGTGKTSLAKSISQATDRTFAKISLGGVKDESEIRGHRRTYIGSMPGRIIQTMKKVKVINPLILLDEIDKLGNDYKGDPTSALLEVLDPEQNYEFSDHFIEESYDLSRVLFITTANDIYSIPETLKDRLEVIELYSYTEFEKLKISKNYLLKKVLKNHNLNKKDFNIDSETLLFIIRYYTTESGVRNLERVLNKIARKIVVDKLKKKSTFKGHIVNKENTKRYLGVPKRDYTKKIPKKVIGVVNGLAWTKFGGDILHIEIMRHPGKNNLILTGQLGNVMKESGNICLSYVKTNCENFDITPNFKNEDIHIHVPEGSVPKEGPSAGVTLTTALISSLKGIPVSNKIAMTGEMTLRGKILPIGGLKEKLISAQRSDIEIVFIPKENIRDLYEVPKEILEKIKIYPVSEYKEIYNYIFGKKNDLKNIRTNVILKNKKLYNFFINA